MDLSAAYDTVNHRLLIQKLYNTTQDSELCRVIQNLLSNRRFYVEINKERIRWMLVKNLGLWMLDIGPLIHSVLRKVVYTQYQSFKQVEETIEEALDNLTTYYCLLILKKTQVTAFHLRNKDAKRSLKVVWNKRELENNTHPKYLGVTLDM